MWMKVENLVRGFDLVLEYLLNLCELLDFIVIVREGQVEIWIQLWVLFDVQNVQQEFFGGEGRVGKSIFQEDVRVIFELWVEY